MKLVRLEDRRLLARYFRKDSFLHLYSLGDLDDFYWPRTTYFGFQTEKAVDKVSLLYRSETLPILLTLSGPGVFDKDYVNQLVQFLPTQFYAHFSPGLEKTFSEAYTITDHGGHYKMGLTDYSRIENHPVENIYLLSEKDLEEIKDLYHMSYPGNSFDPHMLSTGQYFGYRKSGKLRSIGGIHVYSTVYRVAALGNITTHPDYLNQGLGRAVSVKLCRSLREKVDLIGLNVKQDNMAALSLYYSLGFEILAEYGEFTLKKRL